LPRQPELDFALFRKIYKVSTVTLSKYAKHHKRLLNHTRDTPAHQEPSCRLGKPAGTHKKLEKDQTLVVAQPSLPQTTFSKLQTKPKARRIDPRSIFNCCKLYDHEGESFQSNFTFKTDQLTSLSKIIAFIVKLLRNSTG